jgi:hypothetical protein
MGYGKSDLDPEMLKRLEQSLYMAADFTPEREMPADLFERALRQKRACSPVLTHRAAVTAGLTLLILTLVVAVRWRAAERVQTAEHHPVPPVAVQREARAFLPPQSKASLPESAASVKISVQPSPPMPDRADTPRKAAAKPASRQEIRRKVRPIQTHPPQRIHAARPQQSVQAVRWQEEVVKVPPSRLLAPGWILQPDPQQQALYITPAVAEFSLESE